MFMYISRTTISQDVQTRFSVQLAIALYPWYFHCNKNFPFILDRNLAKANCTENRVCTSCDIVYIPWYMFNFPFIISLEKVA